MIRFLRTTRADGRPCVQPVCTACRQRAWITMLSQPKRLHVVCGCPAK